MIFVAAVEDLTCFRQADDDASGLTGSISGSWIDSERIAWQLLDLLFLKLVLGKLCRCVDQRGHFRRAKRRRRQVGSSSDDADQGRDAFILRPFAEVCDAGRRGELDRVELSHATDHYAERIGNIQKHDHRQLFIGWVPEYNFAKACWRPFADHFNGRSRDSSSTTLRQGSNRSLWRQGLRTSEHLDAVSRIGRPLCRDATVLVD